MSTKIKYFGINIIFFLFLTSKISALDKELIDVRFGFSSKLFENINLNDAKVVIKLWAENLLSKELMTSDKKYSVKVNIYQNLNELTYAVDKGDVDIVTLSTLDFLILRAKSNLTPLVLSLVSDSKYDSKLLLVKKDSKINYTKDLNNCNIHIARGGLSDISQLWIENLMKQKKIKLNIIEKDNTSKILLSLLLGNINACVVDKRIYNSLCNMNSKLKSDLKIIEESKNFPFGLTCVRNGFNEFTTERLVKLSSEMANDNYGKQILKLFKISGLISYDNNALIEIEKMLINLKIKD